jgi:CBS domain containing-hemolysin-like protein
MLLLILYALTALLFSFLCSIAEAVILSISNAHIANLEQQGKPAGKLLRRLKKNVDQPLAAILTLNTIAHTVGAAGVGAQASVVFGSASLGITSAVLTFLILVFSEIIPKTLGALYWRQLAPITAHGLKWLIRVLYPFVKLSEKLTRLLGDKPHLHGLNRAEFAAMAEVSASEGQLALQESKILQNLLNLREIRVSDVMTPRTVVFSADENLTIAEFLQLQHPHQFSRIPIFEETADKVHSFVLRSDLLVAQAEGRARQPLKQFRRPVNVTLDSMALSQVLDEFIRLKAHLMLVVDEYGDMKGIITLEDIFETLLGLEITDESDNIEDMQKLARKLWKHRAREIGLNIRE